MPHVEGLNRAGGHIGTGETPSAAGVNLNVLVGSAALFLGHKEMTGHLLHGVQQAAIGDSQRAQVLHHSGTLGGVVRRLSPGRER